MGRGLTFSQVRGSTIIRTGGVGGVRVASLGVEHLLGVTVVSGDGKDVAGLLAGIVHGLDCLVGGGNGNNSGVVNTSVADLWGRSASQLCKG
mgnify:CR=1 FL=1|jgi:hypothetical protein